MRDRKGISAAYLGSTIRQVAVKSFGRSKIILFSKSEINKDRDVSTGEENVGRSEGRGSDIGVGSQARWDGRT